MIPAVVIRQRVPVITTAQPAYPWRAEFHPERADKEAWTLRVSAYYIGASIIDPDRPFTINTEA